VLKTYNQLITKLGKELELLVDTPINKIENINKDVANVINAFRNNEISYTPGGGGTYGRIKLDL
jgi:PHP family Zn ribbon phosphoesterase